MATVGLCLPQLGPAVDAGLVREFAQTAEGMGFDHLWVQDHFLYALTQAGEYGGSATAQPERYQSVWAPTELLGAVAAWTSTIRLGTSVLVGGNHYPVQLAQRLATVDRLAGGRLDAIGLSVGWSVEEHRAMGVDPRTRGKRMDEFVPALRACWGPDPVEHHGPFFDLDPCLMQPKPLSPFRLMSGMWSEAGLARTAAQFDLWNPGSLPIPTVQQMLGTINAQRAAGRAPVEVIYRVALESTAGKRMTVDEVAARTAEVRDAGMEGVIVETNFCSEIDSPAAWLAMLASLKPVLDAAHS
ncbi:TIGR03619 family F420-dependent LLM class oxidoreductase [Sporichthya sp.]|uniref:TIGR03619 family F420-dependent LLM class oxidoreductase n=1 Tax=Sporichthya sp. TaxID=65475 RepID=UPI0017E21AF6|nr:TIGR03619 family F420-dependent LLM class oxidoreductase [Sporichthya sp.]MBA3744187.1 TIGR03619 family F420-dependent LLM class oxidoreductase [Sporichthya sp.]